MAVVESSPKKAPTYVLHRDVTGADTPPETVKAHGMNMNGYEYAHIQVVPAAGVNPTTTIYWWSEEASKFILEHTSIAKTGLGNGVPYEFTIECRGRVFFASLSAGAAKVYVSGFGKQHPG